jgi:hypothetical protein
MINVHLQLWHTTPLISCTYGFVLHFTKIKILKSELLNSIIYNNLYIRGSSEYCSLK